MISEQKSNFQSVVTLLNQHSLSSALFNKIFQRKVKGRCSGLTGVVRQGAGGESKAGAGAHVIIRVCWWNTLVQKP